MNKRCSYGCAFGVLFLAVFQTSLSFAQEVGKEPDLRSLAQSGRATLKRLQEQAASWTAVTRLANGAGIFVDVLATPKMRRTVLSVEVAGKRNEVLRIIDRDGIWYVTEGQKTGKYRPFEAPFEMANAYYFLTRAELQCIAEHQGVTLGKYEATKDGVASYRVPLAEPVKRMLQRNQADLEALIKKEPARANNPELMRTMERNRDLVEKGTATKIEIASGMIVQFGSSDRQTEFQKFSWIDGVGLEQFSVEKKQWESFLDDPTTGDTSELLMMSHSGTWRPGQKSPDTDGRLVDLRTGRYRRIPFRGASVMPGCFLKGRTRVVISGLDSLTGVLGLYEIDLKTGANRQLGGEALGIGLSLMPALSPDGKTLAVLHKGAAGSTLDSQIYLVDVETGDSKALGQLGDMAFLSWLPDGNGLVILLRESTDRSNLSSPQTKTICRISLDGQIKKLRDGDTPLLLTDGKTILFQDANVHTWHTCDLDGANVKLYAGGMTGYGFPAAASDGNRILFMHFRTGNAPEPMIFPIGKSDGKPAITKSGLWAMPAWR